MSWVIHLNRAQKIRRLQVRSALTMFADSRCLTVNDEQQTNRLRARMIRCSIYGICTETNWKRQRGALSRPKRPWTAKSKTYQSSRYAVRSNHIHLVPPQKAHHLGDPCQAWPVSRARPQYHHPSGPYPFLSENFPSHFTYDGLVWPTVQHAYQAAKLDRARPGWAELRERIRAEQDLGEVRKLGRSGGWAFRDEGGKLEAMFRIVLAKFQQRRDLALRLHETGDAPIWHVDEEDGYWAVPQRLASRGAGGAGPPGRDWWRGSNWNGRILSVARLLLRRRLGLGAEELKAAVEAEVRRHCPCPEEYADTAAVPRLPAGVGAPLPRGAVIADRYKVERVITLTPDAGSYVGEHCYV
jgi:predicted NAD-dependent protein-ADP-ribosyltransferase YbiA (DUF1768 family)